MSNCFVLTRLGSFHFMLVLCMPVLKTCKPYPGPGLTPGFFVFFTFFCETWPGAAFALDFFGFVAFCGTYPGAVITADFFVLSLVLPVLSLPVSLTYLPLFLRVVLHRWVSPSFGQVAAVPEAGGSWTSCIHRCNTCHLYSICIVLSPFQNQERKQPRARSHRRRWKRQRNQEWDLARGRFTGEGDELKEIRSETYDPQMFMNKF